MTAEVVQGGVGESEKSNDFKYTIILVNTEYSQWVLFKVIKLRNPYQPGLLKIMFFYDETAL